MRARGPRSQARARNTNTENTTEAPTTPTAESSHQAGSGHTGSPFPFGPERGALRRPCSGRMLAGVAASLADYFGVDVTIVRIAFAVLTVVGGAGIPLYLAGLLLIPEEGSDQSIASSVIGSLQSRSR
jgi:phage shock protein PspC (stress-responsive transcriptional regulator)